jgi:endonuclease YncB( thermonuclease family)
MTERPVKDWVFPARVHRVIDGDTLELVMDCGFRSTQREVIRLRDVWAAELDAAEGPYAKAVATSWLAHAERDTDSVWPLMVRTYKTRTGTDIRSFTRYIGTVWRVSDGRCLNDYLNDTQTDPVTFPNEATP